MKIGQISFMQLTRADLDAVRHRRRSDRSTRASAARRRRGTGRTSRRIEREDPRHRRDRVRRAARSCTRCARRTATCACSCGGPSARRSSPRWAPSSSTGDVTDPATSRRRVDGCTHVVHLVAIINGSRADFERVMTEGTKDLARGGEGGRRRAVRADERARHERAAEGLGAVLRGQVGEEQAVIGVRASSTRSSARASSSAAAAPCRRSCSRCSSRRSSP